MGGDDRERNREREVDREREREREVGEGEGEGDAVPKTDGKRPFRGYPSARARLADHGM
jgi:hypothetical protein